MYSVKTEEDKPPFSIFFRFSTLHHISRYVTLPRYFVINTTMGRKRCLISYAMYRVCLKMVLKMISFQIYAFLQKIGLLLMLASKQPCKAKRRKIDMYLSFTALAIRVYTSLHKGMMVILSLAISISSYLEK